MASKYRRKLQATASVSKTEKPPTTTTTSDVVFDSESIMYANWNWFKFERE